MLAKEIEEGELSKARPHSAKYLTVSTCLYPHQSLFLHGFPSSCYDWRRLLKSVSTPGPWLQLEARDTVNSLAKEFSRGNRLERAFNLLNENGKEG